MEYFIFSSEAMYTDQAEIGFHRYYGSHAARCDSLCQALGFATESYRFFCSRSLAKYSPVFSGRKQAGYFFFAPPLISDPFQKARFWY